MGQRHLANIREVVCFTISIRQRHLMTSLIARAATMLRNLLKNAYGTVNDWEKMLIFAYGTENAYKIRLYLLTEKNAYKIRLYLLIEESFLQNLLTKTCSLKNLLMFA